MNLSHPLVPARSRCALALKKLGRASLACLAIAGVLLTGSATAAPYAYVPDIVSDKLTVFDLGAGVAVSRYAVPDGFGSAGVVGFMRGAVVRPGPIPDEIYITNHNTDELMTFNLLTGLVTGRCKTGTLTSTSRGVAITPLGDKIIVTNESETTSGKDVQIFTLPLTPASCAAASNIDRRFDYDGNLSIDDPGNAYSVAINPAGTFAYIPLGIRSVGVLNLTTKQWVKLIDTGASSGPTFVTFNLTGTEAYVTLTNGKIAVINTATNAAPTFINVGAVPQMAVVSGTLLYVLNLSDKSISIVDTITHVVVNTLVIGSNINSFNVLTATGEIIVADDDANEVHRFAVAPPFVQGPVISGGNLTFPGPKWTPIPISTLGPTVPNLPVWSNIPVQSALAGQAVNFDLSTFLAVTLGVTSYTLTGVLPAGLTFNNSNGKITGSSNVEGSVSLKVSATNAFGDSTPKAFSLTIGNAGVISFASATQTISENVGTLAIPVARTSNATGGIGAVSVTCTAVNGTATAGTDFTATAATLNWADGVNGSVMCNIPITNDAIFEPTKTFTVTLTNPTNGVTLGAITTVTVTLNDDDPAPVKTPPVMANMPAQVGKVGTAFSFNAAASCTATEGDPILGYAVASGTLPANVTLNPTTGLISGTPTVAAVANVTISCSDIDGPSVPAGNLQITINPLTPGALSLSGAATRTIAENGGTLALTVDRIGGTDGAVGVTCAAVNGTATAGLDFTATSLTLSWADGDSATKSCNVPIINDAIPESTKAFSVALSNPTGGATLGTQTSIAVTLTDDDVVAKTPPTMANMAAQVGKIGTPFSFNTATSCSATDGDPITGYTVASGTLPANVTLNPTTGLISGTPTAAVVSNVTIACSDIDGSSNPAGSLQITISALVPGVLSFNGAATRTIAENGGSLALSVNRAGGTDGAISVNCAAVNGTATAGTDFTATGLTLSWADGDSAAKSCNVPVINDAIPEPTKAFSVALTSPTGGATLGAQTSIAVTLTDDDAVAKTPPTMANMANQTGKVGAAFSFNTATACAATDGDPITGYTVVSGTLPANVTLNATTGLISGTPTVAVVSNVTIACSDIDGTSNPAGALKITISAMTPGALTIAGAATRTIAENGGALALSVDRTGGTDGAVSVTCAAVNGTATTGLDFTATSLTLSWADGDSTTKLCNVPIINDAIPEATKAFSVALSNPTGGATLGAQTSVAVTLTDDDVVAKTPPTMANLPAQTGTVNTAFSFSVASACTATDGDPITGYTLASGTLPSGITLNGTSGVISGTPTAVGTANVSIKCSDVDGLSAAAGTLAITVLPQTSYSAASATASGTISVAISGGGASCGFGTRQFIPVSGNAASPPVAPPAGTAFPHGLFDFTLKDCTPGSAVTLTITYPAALAAGTQYYKYGPTPSNAAAAWYVLPSTVAGSTVTFTITDGALGDDDLSANGTIVDQGGPSVAPVVIAAPITVPTLHPAMIALLALMLGLLGRVSPGFNRRRF